MDNIMYAHRGDPNWQLFLAVLKVIVRQNTMGGLPGEHHDRRGAGRMVPVMVSFAIRVLPVFSSKEIRGLYVDFTADISSHQLFHRVSKQKELDALYTAVK